MHIPVSAAKAQLTDLVRKAEAGEEVILTRRGRPAVRLVAERPPVDLEKRDRAIAALIAEARANPPPPGPCAARSADFLYDEEGLPA